MKKVLAAALAAAAVSASFAGCHAEPGDTTKDGFIGGTAQNIAYSMSDTAPDDTARLIKTNVAEYYQSRHRLYGGYGRGTVGYEFAAGYGLDDYNPVHRYDDDNYHRSNGVVIGDMDTNANLASDSSASSEVTDPKSPSGLVINGSDNVE